MSNQTSDQLLVRQTNDKQDVFISLMIGLSQSQEIANLLASPELRRALNALALLMEINFPKTLYAFLQLCERPVEDWYPYPLPKGFPKQSSLLYDGILSQEAQQYLFDVLEQLQLSGRIPYNVPATIFDGLLMSNLLRRLYRDPDPDKAQQAYVAVRNFLITHSYWTAQDLRQADLDQALQEEIVAFYEDAPFAEGSDFYVCDRCGILHWHNGRWRGIKPDYCHDHEEGAKHVHRKRTPRNLRRLKAGIHSRIFLPGQAELRLFEWADELHANYPHVFAQPERYPNLDAYDLSLSFSDETVWAIDVKDHTSPYSLAPKIQPIHGTYTHAFYVIPDRRLEALPSYLHDLRQKAKNKKWPTDHYVLAESDFRQRVEEKLKQLTKPRKPPKGKAH